jgi:hypothetical protein
MSDWPTTTRAVTSGLPPSAHTRARAREQCGCFTVSHSNVRLPD